MELILEIAKTYGLTTAFMAFIIYIGWKEYKKEKDYNRERDKEDMQVITELNIFVKGVQDELKDINKTLIDIKNNQNGLNN